MKTFFFLGISSLLVHAADKPACDVSVLTRDCRIFDSYPAEIKLSDGTSFPNPRHPKTDPQGMGMGMGMGMKPDPAKMEEYDNSSMRLIQARRQLAKALSSEKKMTSEFQMNVLTDPHFVFFSFINFDKNGKLSKKQNMLNMPVKFLWPPNGNQQNFQTVSIDDMVEFMNSENVSLQTRRALKDVIELQIKSHSILAGAYSNPASNEALNSQQEQQKAHMQQRRDKAKELFDVAKNSFKKNFERNASNKNKRALNQTIDDLTIKFEDEIPSDLRKPCQNGPNAYYNPPTHTFVVCDSVLNYPDNQLVGIIGHEMGHSISACSLSLGLDKVDPQMLESLLSKKSANANRIDNELLEDLKRAMPQNHTVRINNDYFMSESFRSYTDKIKLFTPIVEKIDKEDYPFAKVKECIVKNSNFRIVSEEDSTKLTSTTSQVFQSQGSPLSVEDQRQLQSRNEYFIECLGGFDKADESDEAMSDMWGALAMEEYLTQHPPKSDLEKISLYSFFGISYCNHHQEEVKYTSKIRPQQLSLLSLRSIAKSGRMQDQLRLSLVHPPHEVRLNDLYFSLPKIAEILDCSPGKNTQCFDKLKNFSHQNETGNEDAKREGQTR